MTRGRHAKPSKVNQKLSVGVIAGVTGLGTMFSMVPASFADTLPSNNESQNTTSSAVKLSGLQGAQISLDAASSALGSLALQTTGYQTQAKQQAVAENLSNLTKNLEGILHDTPYMSKLTEVQSGLDSVENTLKTPNLANSDLEGQPKTQGQLQNLVKQLQTIINDASTQYGTELKNAVDDYNKDNLPATETGVNNAIKAAQSVYATAQAANNPDLASANNTFSTNAGAAQTTAGSTSDSSTILGKAEALQQNAENQLNNINTEIKGYYNDSASPASGTLVTDATNFDNWAHNWWSTYKKDNSNWTGYQTLLSDLSNCIDAIHNGNLNGSTITGTSSSGAQAVLQNLEVVREAVETMQTLTKDSDLASKTADQAYQLAYKYALGPSEEPGITRPWGDDLKVLVDFVNDLTPLFASSSGTAPSPMTGPYSTYEAWPSDNPFGGAGATTLWTDLSNIKGLAFGLPEWGNDSNLKPIQKAWEQDYSNYKYLQAVQPYAESIESEAQTALAKAQDAASKIAAAKQLADQNTGDSASDAAAAAQAKADIQAALQDVAAANSAGEAIKAAMSSAAAQHASATSSTPTVTINGQTVTLPEATNEDPLYSSADMDTINSDFGNYVNQANNLLSGSDSGTGTGGLLGDATAWQKAIVTQGVFNDAQKAYNAIQGVQQDLKNVEAAPNPGAAIDSLNKLQSDLTPLINDTQSAVTGMQNGNQTIQGLGLAAPYSQSDISDAQTPLTSALPLASASNDSNPIQKAIVNGNDYNFAHPIVVGLTNLEPTIHALIGQGSEPGTAQKILALPFQVLSAMGSSQGAMTGMPSGGAVHVQSAKPADDLASTGSDAVAAAIGAATLLAAGVAAELLKKKGLKREK